VYQGEGEQGQEGLSRSERDMEFVTTQIQSIITRIEMVAQDLIQTASRDDVQRLKRSMRAFKSALA
jgi:mevalonate kinase